MSSSTYRTSSTSAWTANLPILGCHLGSIPGALRHPQGIGCLPCRPGPFIGLRYLQLPTTTMLFPRGADALSVPFRFSCAALRSYFAFVFLTGSCDRRQIMSTKALETKKTSRPLITGPRVKKQSRIFTAWLRGLDPCVSRPSEAWPSGLKTQSNSRQAAGARTS